MTTVMEEKMLAAGIQMPTQVERLWRVLRDNPQGLTAQRAAALTGIANASTQLSMMVRRKMATARSELQRRPIHGGVMAERPVNIYSTTMKEYELLPAPKKEKPSAPAVSAPTAPPAPAVQRAPAPPRAVPTVAEAQAFVERMTIAEARALWAVMDRMFGGAE